MNALPLQLQARAQWVAFRLEPDPARPDKPRKVPYVGRERRYSEDAQLLSYRDACELAQTDGFKGVGFRFTAADPFCCVDLDNCREPETGVISPDARAVLDRFPPNAYVEVSISGKGLHVLAIGKPVARGKSADGKLEMYDRGQYVALTGSVLEGRTEIVECAEVLTRLKAERGIGAPKLDKQPLSDAELKAKLPVRHLDLTDAELLRVIADEHPTWFAHYMDADVSGQRDASKDDAALIRTLIEYVGWDEARIEALAHTSALKRAKWGEKREGGSWLRYTIRNLLRSAASSAQQRREGEDPAARWPLYTVEQLLNLPEPAWLVPDVLFAGGLTLLYGLKGTYKSFVGLSLAAAVATGQPWLDEKRKATKGAVVYVVAEGQGFFRRRVQALGLDNHARLRIVPAPVNLFKGEAQAFVAYVRAQLPDEPIALVVIDTLARSMAGAEENSNSDMMAVVGGAQLFQRDLGAAVLLVHHTGATGERVRGASALPMAADVVLRLIRPENTERRVTLKFENTKDLQEPAPLGLLLRPTQGSLEVVIDPEGPAVPKTKDGKPSVGSRRFDIVACCKHEAQTVGQIANALDLPERTVRAEIQTLEESGRLKCVGKAPGRGGAPLYVWAQDPVDSI